ncbi:MAG: hypothetical protein EP329_13015 [Deltaproteobacteria bacterium]|nr:MAG: hypothetical protein EP329_13015 [Deltaproteobacteria bacterium]
MRRHLTWIAALTATALSSACISMQYQPRDTPYVKIVQVDGMQKWRVGNVDYTGGILGGLDQAVASVPEARDHAEEAESDAIVGLVLTLVGSTLVGLGTAGMSSDAAGEGVFGADTTSYSAVFMLGGLATVVGAAFKLSSATAHQVDAVNVFNDAMWAQEHEEYPAPTLPALQPLDPSAP